MPKFVSIVLAFALSICASIFSASAHANNYQDLWWNANESGWGINISQQGDVMFATWFIYGANSQPTWIFLSRAERSGALGNTFTGDIFQATGSPFSAVPFVPLQGSNLTKVGTATLVFSDARSGTLTYSINGANVVKQITRQVIGFYNLTGTYFGGLKRDGSGCVAASLNGSTLNQATYSINHGPSTGALTITEVGGTLCNFSGTTQVFGSILEGSGTFSCAAENITGSWTMREGRPTPNAFSALLALRPNGESCTLNASIGGLKPQ
ncbi:MAG: hypothetical protein ABL931_15980 [Usitatibacteraceae bacterium]